MELKNYEGMIYKQAKSFPQLELDDAMAQCRMIFVESVKMFDPNKANFGTFLYMRLRQGLIQMVRKQQITVSYDLEPTNEQSPDKICELKNMLENASSEAKEVARIVITAPEDFLTEYSKITKETLTKYLRGKGRKFREIKSCFKELSEILG